MKSIYLLAAGLFLVCIAHAQVKKGDMLLGGNLSFARQSSTADSSSSVYTATTLAPSFGIAIRDNLLVGFNLLYAHSDQDDATRANTYGLGLFVRRYKALGSGFSVFAEGDLQGSYFRQTDDNANPANISMQYNVIAGFYPGIAYNITRRVQLETGFQNMVSVLYIHSTREEGADKITMNTLNISTSLNNSLTGFTVGLKYILN